MKPTYDNVVLKELKERHNLLIDSSYMNKSTVKAEVVELGPDCSTDLKIGDVVYFMKDEGRVIDGLRVVKEKHLLCIAY